MAIANKKIFFCLSIGLFFSCWTLPVKAESVLEKIQKTGVIRLAIREDAAPFGYLDAGGNLQGYCLDFFALLERKVIDSLERDTLSIKLLKSTIYNRFSLISNNLVDLECGPNTIRDDVEESISFSTAFFQTGAQFLVKRQNRDRLDLDGNLDKARIGVLKNTSTEEYVAATYPQTTIQQFSGVTARSRGVQALVQGKIDGMISDGILLRAEAQKQGLSSSEYPLIPETPLTCDRYGTIVNSQDKEWLNFINSVINSPEAANLAKAWFDNYSSNRIGTFDKCSLQSTNVPEN